LENKIKKKKDYCTLFFDKIRDYDLSGCCLIHDEGYEDQNISRKENDYNLKICVNNVTHSKLGNLMYLGVRTFGWIFWFWYKWVVKNKKS
jgi:hypothetical protein